MRDLKSDKAICEKATPGPWHKRNQYWITGPDKGHICKTEYADGLAVKKREENAEFIAAARTGWPEAIERAIKAEEENAALRDKMQKINDIADDYQEDGPFGDTVTFAIISEIYDLSLGKE